MTAIPQFPSDQVYSVLENVAKTVNKAFDLEVAVPGEKEVKSDVTIWVPTKSVLLNLLMGEANYGIAAGRVFELFGDFSEGKSTLAQVMMNGFQAAGGISVLLDSESSWNRDRAVKMGHDPKRHLAVDIETCEMGFKVITETVAQFKRTLGGRIPVLFVWDTIAASPTESEKAGDEFDSGMMFKPRLIRSELRKLTPELKKIQASIVFVNQTIEGPKPNRTGIKTTPGGGGIKFWASQRLQVEKVGNFSDRQNKEVQQGIISSVKVVKNKLAPPFKSADITLDFNLGLDPIREVTNYLLDKTSVYNVAGAYKRIVGFGDNDITFYEKDIESIFDKNPGLYDWCVENVRSHWLSGETL